MTIEQIELQLKEILGDHTFGPILTHSGVFELFEPTIEPSYCYCESMCNCQNTMSYNTLVTGKTLKELIENYKKIKVKKKNRK